jgi:hypothetical protein
MTTRGPNRRQAVAGVAAALIAPARAAAQKAVDPAAPAGPVRAVNGVATFALKDFVADGDGGGGALTAAVDFPGSPSRRRLSAAKPHADAEARLLQAMLRRGAAGNHGDLYDNRDRDHSRLRMERHPRLTFVEYADDARAAGLDYGLNLRIRFNAPTIGNSSTAVTGGATWRSQPRLALTNGGAPALSRIYGANHLYVYPEHRDHDPERGDLFPAATPFFVVSQGSSGSDRPFMRALVDMLAAMRPETKTRLRESGLLAPALQMLLRRNMRGVDSDEDYLSGLAHPSAFEGERIDLDRMLNGRPTRSRPTPSRHGCGCASSRRRRRIAPCSPTA